MLSRIQYISQGSTAKEQKENILRVLDAGVNWVQLRNKEVEKESVMHLSEVIKKSCESYDAKLIINDYADVAVAVDADGVHLGLTDQDVVSARVLLGNDKFIGGTANTVEQVQQRIQEGCDYIGLGPFRYTATKAKLSPVLGIPGYLNILGALNGNVVPVFAIGGIGVEDIESLLASGVYGVAVSALLTKQPSVINVLKKRLYE